MMRTTPIALAVVVAGAACLATVVFGCNKSDTSAAPASSAGAAPSGSADDSRRGHEHEWDGGGHGDHGDHPH
jgi:hypothetical protein